MHSPSHPTTSHRPLLRCWPLFGLLATGLLCCAGPQAHTATPLQDTEEGSQFVYDGQDHSWSERSEAPLESLALPPGDSTLSGEPWISATNGWGPVERDRSNGEKNAGDGRALTLNGQTYAQGFGVHANSSLSFNLNGQCQSFTAEIGVDDEVGNRGSVVFQVYGDGSKLYDSGVMTGAGATKSLKVSVAGRKELKLVVTDAANGLSYDHADWAAPTVLGCVGGGEGAAAIRINAGGPAQTVGGVTWLGCTGVGSCGGYVRGGFAYGEPDSISGVAAPANTALYQTEWTGGQTTGVPAGGTAFSLNVPVPSGAYTVRLHFAELNKFAPGARVFDVNLEGGPAELPAFDVFQAAGGAGRAVVRSFPVTVTDGTLNIEFIRRVENAKVSGVEILPVSTAPPPPQALRWTERAPALKAVSEAQGAAVNGRLYVFGGFDQNLFTTPRAQVYDAAANRWTAVRDLPEQLTHAAVAVDGQTIYVIGGFVGNHPGPQTSHVWKYSVATDTWSAGPSLPGARGAGAAARLGRELHFFGGVERDRNNLHTYLRDSPDHWVLSLDGGTAWRSAAPLPNPRNHLAGAELGGKLYAIGGQHLGDENAGNQNSVHAYDPATNTWTARAGLPQPLGHINASTVVLNGRLVVIAGVGQSSREVATVYEYDPGANRWTPLTALPAARQSPVAGVIGGRLVVSGGSLPSGVFATTWLGER